MAKVIRLTENDVQKLVKKILKESEQFDGWNFKIEYDNDDNSGLGFIIKIVSNEDYGQGHTASYSVPDEIIELLSSLNFHEFMEGNFEVGDISDDVDIDMITGHGQVRDTLINAGLRDVSGDDIRYIRN